jgi:hypothetical protein
MNTERIKTLAAFIHNQCELTDKHPHKVGPGSVNLNYEEALLCAGALDYWAHFAIVNVRDCLPRAYDGPFVITWAANGGASIQAWEHVRSSYHVAWARLPQAIKS